MKKLFFVFAVTALLFFGCGGAQEKNDRLGDTTTTTPGQSSTSINDSVNSDSLTVDSGGETMPKKPEQP
ncbi:hypothetical protein [Pedobacter endophyticus]|uniref:Uncharacterized protein n=1 Tax=Pedobacter endophyticus TaxID=2789740 RepID=A0A7S9KY84_9SPHI|nr:hypothetical protein [Pedobacter endophyticus]QPH39031.1 hypothetical protein IZT61_18505 [Pedobacter endophyticus]